MRMKVRGDWLVKAAWTNLETRRTTRTRMMMSVVVEGRMCFFHLVFAPVIQAFAADGDHERGAMSSGL